MRLVTYRLGEGTRAGLLEGDTIQPLPFSSVDELLRSRSLDSGLDAETGEDSIRLEDVELSPVVVRPGKIICIGLNYEDHIKEVGRELPEYPTLFAKFASALTGPYDSIEIPPETVELDWEVELAAIIGRAVRRVGKEEGLQAVAGYSVSNDVSARDWQMRTGQWLQGKNLDRSTPLGPALVTADEIDDPADFQVSCLVNDDVVQESSTRHLVFDVGDAVSYISTLTTLEPGDVLLTGTPSGVGAGRTPKIFLSPGDTLISRIEGLGTCENLMV